MSKVLIIGSGGREHAIGWKIKQSPKVNELYFLPGNGGTSEIGSNIDIKASDNEKIVTWAKENAIDLVVVAPDPALAAGLVDDLTIANIKAFGPTKAAAEIEWSKAFSKQLMREENIPTAKFETFSDFESARKYLDSQSFPIVIKASGLALGKGVTIAENLDQAIKALKNTMVDKVFGDSGNEVVIEEFLKGFEVSFHAFCDGENYSLFPTSQDHKPIYDNDKGPNTGGMGTIAPVSQITSILIDQIKKEVIEPTLRGLKKKGQNFKGILYPGIMMTIDGPKVLEFNARFGDPETQVYMRLLKSDLFDIFNACIDGTIKNLNIEWSSDFACCVVLAAGGYPVDYSKGFEITGLDDKLTKDVVIFHAGSKKEDEKLVTAGGRVLGVSAVGESLDEALNKSYEAIKKINFEGIQFRSDIGKRLNKV